MYGTRNLFGAGSAFRYEGNLYKYISIPIKSGYLWSFFIFSHGLCGLRRVRKRADSILNFQPFKSPYLKSYIKDDVNVANVCAKAGGLALGLDYGNQGGCHSCS